MKMDFKLLTGIFVGLIAGLHYHTELVTYMPLLVIATLVLILRIVRGH
jgi:hypothetical protein